MITFRIGDQAPPASRAPLFDAGAPGDAVGGSTLLWHALLVYPQRETAARQWLDHRGVYSFFPVRKERRQVRGRWIEQEARYLPGYLFAAFPAAPWWHTVFGGPFIRDAIRRFNGDPGRLHPDSIKSLKAMAAVDGEIETRWRIAQTIRKGDKVRITSGPFEGYETEVVELTATGGVKVRLELIGATVVEVNAGAIKRVGA